MRYSVTDALNAILDTPPAFRGQEEPVLHNTSAHSSGESVTIQKLRAIRDCLGPGPSLPDVFVFTTTTFAEFQRLTTVNEICDRPKAAVLFGVPIETLPNSAMARYRATQLVSQGKNVHLVSEPTQ